MMNKQEKENLKKEYLNLLNNDKLLKLKAAALRKEFFGNKTALCVIINAKSGLCSENCRYCAQSSHYTTGVDSYPMVSANDIFSYASKYSTAPIGNLGIVTSGPSLSENELDIICEAIEMVSKNCAIDVCASLGNLSANNLEKLKKAGLKRYHHNLETSERFFPEICTTHTWDERVETVLRAKELNLEVCSGGLFGLGETWEDRIDLAITLKELKVDCIPINFLNAIDGTPLASQPKLQPSEALSIISLYRYILPEISLRVCGGRSTVLGQNQYDIFEAGANAMMTGDYLTTFGTSPEMDICAIKHRGLELS
ncbi:MAG TPA: biotin synthase BioB [Lentisphaeria bacterium]|nr:MAG: biotin synthase BioB [Lentisphaerae bacterium GWF2_38_69]HBM17221.1 biotin synthase BioB [Lentisphaeria bacterium]